MSQTDLNRLSTAYSQGHKQQIQALQTRVSQNKITGEQFERSKNSLEKEYKAAWDRIKNNNLNASERKWIRDQNYRAVLARMKAVTDRALVVSSDVKKYTSDVKKYTAEVKKYTQAVEVKTAKSPTWTVTDPRTGEVEQFSSREEAKKFSSDLSSRILATSRSATRDERARMQEVASQSPERMALATMVSEGLVKSSKTDKGETYTLKGDVKDLSSSDILLAKTAGFKIPVGVTGKKEKKGKPKPILEAIQHTVGVLGSAYEGIFTSVTNPINKASQKALKTSIDKATKGKPVEGFGAYAVGTTLRTVSGVIDVVTFPVRPESWADAAEAVSLMLMPEKGETRAHYKSRLSDMVKNDVYDPKMRAQMEGLLLTTMPPTPVSSKDIQAGKEFRKALAESIMADPVGFLVEVTGGIIGARLLSSAAGRLSSKMKMELSQADRLEVLRKQPWSGGMAVSQESEWWLNQVVDDLVDNLNPDKTLRTRFKRLSYKKRFDKSMGAFNARSNVPKVENPWSLALSTPGAYNAIRDGLRDKGLTDEQIDNLLVDVMRADEITFSGVGPSLVYTSPQAVAEFSGIKPSQVPYSDIRVGIDATPLELQISDVALDPLQIEIQEVVPEVTEIPDTPKPEPKKPTKPEEPTKPDEPRTGKPRIPPKPKGKDDKTKPNVFRALVGGLKEKYRITFDYPKGKSESFTVTARSFPLALSQATPLRRVKYVPSEVDIVKAGKPRK